MARAIASGSVQFGLVNIPVKLYSATESKAAVSFNLLHKDCGSRLKQQYFCIKEDVPVARDAMVKGYEFAKEQYVVFTPEELKALEEESTQAIEITEFVPADKVDPVYFDKAYYLGPDKGGEKAYRLLARALADTERVALAKYAARGKQYLCVVRPSGDRLVMQQLHYADEIRPIADVPIADSEVREPELKMAKQLIEQGAHETFDPTQYKDEVKERIEKLVQQKVDGQEIQTPSAGEPKAQIIDLMEALKASLSQKGDRKSAKRAEEKPAKTKSAKSK